MIKHKKKTKKHYHTMTIKSYGHMGLSLSLQLVIGEGGVMDTSYAFKHSGEVGPDNWRISHQDPV